MDLKLKGKTALVLASSGGLGKAIATELIKEGVKVCLNSSNENNLKKCKEEIGAFGYVAMDLTKPGSGEELLKKAIKVLGHVDILVTNAGGPSKNNFLSVTSEQWQNDFQSLWMSTVETIKSALPQMQQNRFGRIIFITSIAAKEAMNGLTTSNGLRAGLMGLCKSLSNEVAQYNITVNCVLPGFTNTDRLKNLNLSSDYVKSVVPAHRLGEPNELADLVTFLSSERASYITGQSIAVDGGHLKGF